MRTLLYDPLLGYSLLFLASSENIFLVSLAPLPLKKTYAASSRPVKKFRCYKCCCTARRVLARGRQAGNQSYIILYHGRQAHCVNGRGAISPVTSQWIAKMISKRSFQARKKSVALINSSKCPALREVFKQTIEWHPVQKKSHCMYEVFLNLNLFFF